MHTARQGAAEPNSNLVNPVLRRASGRAVLGVVSGEMKKLKIVLAFGRQNMI